jgi:hypothetical protein
LGAIIKEILDHLLQLLNIDRVTQNPTDRRLMRHTGSLYKLNTSANQYLIPRRCRLSVNFPSQPYKLPISNTKFGSSTPLFPMLYFISDLSLIIPAWFAPVLYQSEVFFPTPFPTLLQPFLTEGCS